jgi:DNA-binding beta-propeller fold protein YncE
MVRPAASRAESSDGGEVLGHSPLRYRVVPGWGELDPERHPVNDCHGMVQDSEGRAILLTNHTENNVIVYDTAGELLETWGTEYPGAHGLSLVREDGEDRLWITDHDRHEVYKTTLAGEVLMKIGPPEEYPSADRFKPTRVAVAPNGDLFVCDGYGMSFVIQYDAEGNFKRMFGGKGPKGKHLQTPHGAIVDTRGRGDPLLVVASRGEHCLKRFTLEGEYLDTIPMPGARVCDLQVHEGRLYVANLNGFLSILDENNRVVSQPGGNEPVYGEDGRLKKLKKATDTFIHPHSILVDREGGVYVPQWNSNQTYPVKLEPLTG